MIARNTRYRHLFSVWWHRERDACNGRGPGRWPVRKCAPGFWRRRLPARRHARPRLQL